MKRLAVILAILSACSKAPPAGGAPMRRSPRVTVTTVVREAVTYDVETVGTLEAQEQVAVAAGVAGVVGSVKFREGDKVSTDTVLCTIDEERYTLEADRARAEKARAAADVDHARSAFDRRKKLHEQKMISDDELAEFKAQLDRAIAEADRATAALALADKAKRDCRVRPPIAGIINSRTISTGEYVKVETMIATIADVSTMHVRFAVPETESARVRAKQTIEFTARVLGGKPQGAEIFWVSQTADPKTRTVECKARMANPDDALKPGFSGIVTLVIEEKPGALVVPAAAVLPTERGFIAFIVDKGKAAERKLTLGLHTRGDKVEVLDGLEEGQTLIVRGAAAVRNGQDVEIVE